MSKIKYQDKKLGRPRKGVYYKEPTDEIVIISKWKGTCSKCHKTIPAKSWVIFSKSKRTIKHNVSCPHV